MVIEDLSYLDFLIIFLLPMLAVVGLLLLVDRFRGIEPPPALACWPGWVIIALHVLLAVTWTTPWDNYLVYAGVWFYPEGDDPRAVLGRIGYVPVEEYCFFVLQTVGTGGLLLWLRRRLGSAKPMVTERRNSVRIRVITTGILGVIWLASAVVLVGLMLGFASWTPLTYLALILIWALVPLMLQTGYGADILWHHRWLVGIGIAVPTLYLATADAIAIASGTWTIEKTSSIQAWGLSIGVLPFEEALFFLMTNVLVVCGSTLAMAKPTQERMPEALLRFLRWLSGRRD